MSEEGLCPLSGAKVYSPMVKRFHVAVASMRCFDVRKNCPERRILFDFQDPEQIFVSKLGKAPMFGPMFWPIFTVILKELNLLGKKIMGAKSEQDIEKLIMEQITV